MMVRRGWNQTPTCCQKVLLTKAYDIGVIVVTLLEVFTGMYLIALSLTIGNIYQFIWIPFGLQIIHFQWFSHI